MKFKELENKLADLRSQLHYLETTWSEVIRERRVLADMGDDYRENEGAKLVMEQHDILWIRKLNLKKEILEIKKEIIRLKAV